MTDTLQIFLRDCRINLRTGIYEHEKKMAQPVIINVDMETALPSFFNDLNESQIDRIVNYEYVHTFIRETLPTMGHIPLLETIAEQIIAYCFKDSRILKATVRIEKPKVFKDSTSAGIAMTRTRKIS